MAVVSGWGQDVDDLADAVADLLTDISVRTSPLTDAAATLACRDAVVVELRQLAGAVADMPPVARARPLQMFDVTNRPAQALQQALSELPRASQFGAADVDTYFEKGLPPYEQRWRDAARAAVGLEIFVEALGRVPDRHCWSVLRDLADLLQRSRPWTTTCRRLSCRGSMAGRTWRWRTRCSPIPATTPSGSARPRSAAAYRPSRPRPPRRCPAPASSTRRWTATCGPCWTVARSCRSGTCARSPGSCSSEARMPRSCSSGRSRPSPVPTSPRPPYARSRRWPSSCVTARPRPSGRNIWTCCAAVASCWSGWVPWPHRNARCPGGASDTALRRLAAPALEFAKHVPNLARAVEIAVREALAGGLMLVPSAADKSNTSSLLWVPASRGSGRSWKDGPPVVQQHVSAMARAAEGVAPGVRTAQAALDQHQVQIVDPACQAAAQARSHVGAARAQLREVLGQQAGTFPPPLSSPLPSHARLAPDGPVSGRGR